MSILPDFDSLFAELETFDPDIDVSDLYVPPSIPSSSSQSSNIVPNFPFTQTNDFSSLCFVSQNVMKSNTCIHSLLNISSSPPFAADIILIQEPWYGRIGIDVISGKDIYGIPFHRDWMSILPPHGDQPPDVAIYVPKARSLWQVQARSDLFSNPSILAIDVITEQESFLVINVYNPSDNSVLPYIIHTDFPCRSKVVIAGDFNLHHPSWSRSIHHTKISEESELLVDSMSSKGFLTLNSPGIETFFRKDYTSVLDLVWISASISTLVTDFKVNHPMHSGGDHYPITWSINFSPISEIPVNYLFHDDK